MNHQDHLYLLRPGIESVGGLWADFGSGTGAFTRALAELIGPGGEIYSLDQDRSDLREQETSMGKLFPQAQIHFLPADITKPLDLPALDGIVMANTLHFFKQKEPLIRRIKGYLKAGGRFILVEYNVDRGNPWVPYPLSYSTWEELARSSGFASTRLLATRPSRFLREFYSALSI